MPVYSERHLLIKCFKRILKILILDGKEDTADFREILASFYDIQACRYLNPREPIPQSDGLRNLLHHFPDNTFKQMVRCSKENFVRIIDLIKDDPVFHNNSLFSQYSVEIQLMVTLIA